MAGKGPGKKKVDLRLKRRTHESSTTDEGRPTLPRKAPRLSSCQDFRPLATLNEETRKHLCTLLLKTLPATVPPLPKSKLVQETTSATRDVGSDGESSPAAESKKYKWTRLPPPNMEHLTRKPVIPLTLEQLCGPPDTEQPCSLSVELEEHLMEGTSETRDLKTCDERSAERDVRPGGFVAIEEEKEWGVKSDGSREWSPIGSDQDLFEEFDELCKDVILLESSSSSGSEDLPVVNLSTTRQEQRRPQPLVTAAPTSSASNHTQRGSRSRVTELHTSGSINNGACSKSMTRAPGDSAQERAGGTAMRTASLECRGWKDRKFNKPHLYGQRDAPVTHVSGPSHNQNRHPFSYLTHKGVASSTATATSQFSRTESQSGHSKSQGVANPSQRVTCGTSGSRPTSSWTTNPGRGTVNTQSSSSAVTHSTRGSVQQQRKTTVTPEACPICNKSFLPTYGQEDVDHHIALCLADFEECIVLD